MSSWLTSTSSATSARSRLGPRSRRLPLVKSSESTLSDPSSGPETPMRDDGFTLVELLVTMTIFGVIIAMVFATYTVIANVTRRSVESSDAVTQARLGLAQIDGRVV